MPRCGPAAPAAQRAYRTCREAALPVLPHCGPAAHAAISVVLLGLTWVAGSRVQRCPMGGPCRTSGGNCAFANHNNRGELLASNAPTSSDTIRVRTVRSGSAGLAATRPYRIGVRRRVGLPSGR